MLALQKRTTLNHDEAVHGEHYYREDALIVMGRSPMGWCGSWGGMVGVDWLVVLLLLVVVGYLAYRWGQSQATGSALGRPDGRGHSSDEPLEITRRRYARGEITRDEFEQLKRDLHP